MDRAARLGEATNIPFRSNRYFCVGNKWYFSTREGFDSGPYATRERAESGMRRFLDIVQMLPASSQTSH